jgi:hypothetical protein
MLFAGLGIFVGAALPWALVLGQSLWGSPLALSWTLWAGLMTLAAAMIPWRPLFLLSALSGGGTALFFAVWQTARVLDRCPLSLDCLPGPGLGLLLVAGGAAVYQAGKVLLAWVRAG